MPVFQLLIWLLILFIFPFIGDTIEPGQIATASILLLASFSVGSFIIPRIRSYSTFNTFTTVGVSIILGWFLISLTIFLDLPVAFYIVMFLFLMAVRIYYYRSIRFSLHKITVHELCIVLACMVATIPFTTGYAYMFSTEKLPLFSKDFVGAAYTDPLYFISLVGSLRSGTAYSAIYDQGAALNYQVIGFVAPAFLAKITGVSSQVALYGIWFSLLKIFPFTLVAELTSRMIENKKTLFLVLSIVFMVLFQPLHPLYVLKWVPDLFVWGGTGYLGISTNIGYDLAMTWSLLLIILIYPKSESKELTFFESVVFVLLLSLLIGIKIPMFLAFASLAGIASIIRIFRSNSYKLFLLLLLSVIPTLLVMYFVYFQDQSPVKLNLKYGYIPFYYSELTKVALNSWLSHLKIYLIIFLLAAIWGGIRFIGILIVITRARWGNKEMWELSVSTLFAFVLCLTVASFYSVDVFDHNGSFLLDGSFDALQFLRSAFYFISVTGSIAIIYTFLNVKNKFIKIALIAAAFVWCSISLINFMSTSDRFSRGKEDPWMTEVRATLAKVQPSLIAINPLKVNYSLPLAASDVGQFWIAFGKINGGYNCSVKNAYRLNVYSDLTSLSVTRQTKAIQHMKHENVDVMVFTPGEEAIIQSLLKGGLISPAGSSSWVYKIN